MGGPSDSLTSPSLLGRLRQNPADQAAWGEFVDRYGRKIYVWCRQLHLQDADAEDVTQMVLVRLAQRLATFTYDPSRSFRGWLRTLTQHAWSDFLKKRERAGRGSGDRQVEVLLESLQACDSLLVALEEPFDRELLEEAMARVRLRVTPQSWEAFRLTAFEEQSGAEVARTLNMQVAAVFKAKSRVQRLLQQEIAELDGDPS